MVDHGLVFVGEIDGKHVKADVYFEGDPVNIEGRLWFTLDQWTKLRALGLEDDGDNPIWATTEKEYEDSTGEPLHAV